MIDDSDENTFELIQFKDEKEEKFFNKCRAICDGLAAGKSYKVLLNMHNIEGMAFHRALNSFPELGSYYAAAQRNRAELLVDDIEIIADTERDPLRARVRIQARQWLAGKLHQRKYGDSVNINVEHRVNIAQALAEAQKRLVAISVPNQSIKSVESYKTNDMPKKLKESQKKQALVFGPNRDLIAASIDEETDVRKRDAEHNNSSWIDAIGCEKIEGGGG